MRAQSEKRACWISRDFEPNQRCRFRNGTQRLPLEHGRVAASRSVSQSTPTSSAGSDSAIGGVRLGRVRARGVICIGSWLQREPVGARTARA